MYSIMIRGHIGTKKNGKVAMGGYVVTTRVSKQELAGLIFQARSEFKKLGLPTFEKLKDLRYRFYVRDGRSDVDGKIGTLQDCLVQGGVVRNDSIARIPRFSAEAIIVPKGEEERVVVEFC